MSDKNRLADEIAKLQAIHMSLAMLSNRTDGARKMELVNLRRDLSSQIGLISNVAEQGFLTTADENTAREFRNLLSDMRRAVALHQANFPAVKLDELSSEYQVSVKSVREANSRFMQWAGSNLGRVAR